MIVLFWTAWLCVQAETSTIQLHPAVRLMPGQRSEPVRLRWWCVTIELSHPDLELFVTPPEDVPEGFHTRAETTLTFAQRHQVLAAINASPFDPLPKRAGEPVRIDGLHLWAGQLVAQAKPHFGALLLSPGRAEIFSPPVPEEAISKAHHGVGGFSPLVRLGQNLFTQEDMAAPRHPRTAVGLTQDAKTMIWLVVDGRQPLSQGATQRELADLGIAAGCWTMLNLDGGGSSTLVIRDPQTQKHRVVNWPVGQRLPGTLRLNGNHLGVRVRTSAVPSP
jgi:hypothetical protein